MRIILLSDCRLGSVSVVAEYDSTDLRLVDVRFLCVQRETAKKKEKIVDIEGKGLFRYWCAAVNFGMF